MLEIPASDRFDVSATQKIVLEVDLDDGEPCRRKEVSNLADAVRPPFVELPDALKGMYYLG